MAKKKKNKRPGTRRSPELDEAQFEAEANYAESIFRSALGDVRASIDALECSLRFKPDYAPAILSMGSVEYQRGDSSAGWALFERLLGLPDDTPELVQIIDEAGDFLIQQDDYEEGYRLYKKAAARFPDVAVFHQGIGCCAGHIGRMQEAVDASVRALELEPDNQKFVNDLGYSLYEAGRLEEARETLERAVAMDPNDGLARGNLDLCEEALGRQRGKKPRAGGAARKRKGGKR